MSNSARRLDLPIGEVPDYRTFVRHLWSYKPPEGVAVRPPPIMYSILFDQADDDWLMVRETAEVAVSAVGLEEQLFWRGVATDDGRASWELCFGDLTALHAFCVLLGTRARADESEAAVRVGEFVMWTLGFRWV